MADRLSELLVVFLVVNHTDCLIDAWIYLVRSCQPLDASMPLPCEIAQHSGTVIISWLLNPFFDKLNWIKCREMSRRTRIYKKLGFFSTFVLTSFNRGHWSIDLISLCGIEIGLVILYITFSFYASNYLSHNWGKGIPGLYDLYSRLLGIWTFIWLKMRKSHQGALRNWFSHMIIPFLSTSFIHLQISLQFYVCFL